MPATTSVDVKRDAPATKKASSQKAPFELGAIAAFYVFLTSHLIAAFFSPIQDCDEVFNFWEPTHYLNHFYGFQKWE